MAFAADSRANEPSGKTWHPFVVLLAGHTEIRVRSLDIALESTGYAVLHAASGNGALELAMSIRPDAVIIGDYLDDMTGIELCRQLAGNAHFSPATPVLLTSSDSGTRSDRLEAYSAGAWSVSPEPLDEQLLMIRVHTFIRARYVGERLREGSFYDGGTGLYNLDGLLLRAREIGAGAGRRSEAFACVAFAPNEMQSTPGLSSVDNVLVDGIADTCRRRVRKCDVVGRVGASEFAILAPCTNEVGARGMLGRLHHTLNTEAPALGDSPRTLKASICATNDVRESPYGAVEILMRAVSDLRVSTEGRLTRRA